MHVLLGFDELEYLVERAPSVSGRDSDRASVMLMGYVGVRIGEALALTVGDVNLSTHRAHIWQTWTEGEDGLHLGEPKGNKDRHVPLHDFLEDALRPLLEGQPSSAFVFLAPRGGAHTPNNWRSRTWSKIVRDTEWDKALTPHGLRHTAASMAIASGASVRAVQVMLGHASAVETLETYGHLWPDSLDEVINGVGSKRSAWMRRNLPDELAS